MSETILKKAFGEKHTYITYGEALAPLLPYVNDQWLFEDATIVFFIDSQAVLGALVAGTSPATQLAKIACLWQLAYTSVRARCWCEWIESAANIADGPSRILWKWLFTNEARALQSTLQQAKVPDLLAEQWQPLNMLNREFS